MQPVVIEANYIPIPVSIHSKKEAAKGKRDQFHFGPILHAPQKIITGRQQNKSFLTIIDFDVKKGETLELTDLPENIQKTFCVRTGSGGIHAYFHLTDADDSLTICEHMDVRNPKLKGCDLRGNGGFIFGPFCHFEDHPHGYEILQNFPIMEITQGDFLKLYESFILSPWKKINEPKPTVEQEIPKENPALKKVSIDQLRLGYQLLLNGKIQIGHLTQPETGEPEHLYWQIIWKALRNANWTDAEIHQSLQIQKEYNYDKTCAQLKYLKDNKISHLFYEKLFNYWEKKNKTSLFKDNGNVPIVILPQKGRYLLNINNQTMDILYKGDDLLRAAQYLKDGINRKPKMIIELESICLLKNWNLSYKAFLEGIEKNLLVPFIPNQIGVIPKTTPEKVRKIEDLLPKIPVNQRTFFELTAICVSSPKNVKNPIWFIVLGAPSVGKTFTLRQFEDDLVKLYDNITENALDPGKPNKDAPDVFALLAECQNRTIIFNDLSALFSGRREKAENFLGTLVVAYGGHYTKLSPGGPQSYPTETCIIMALTFQAAKQHWQYMNQLGNRFLTVRLERSEKPVNEIFPDIHKEICDLIRVRMKDPLPDITKEVDEKITKIATVIVNLRSFQYANLGELEGIDRLYNQIKLACQCRARLYQRTVNEDDVEFMIEFVVNTIPNLDILRLLCQHIGLAKNHNPKSRIDRIINQGMIFGYLQNMPGEILDKDGVKHSVTRYYFTSDYEEILTFKHKIDIGKITLATEDEYIPPEDADDSKSKKK